MSKLKLFIKQSVIHLRKDILIIAGLAIGLSVIFGMNYYADSYQKVVQDDLESQFQDFYFKIKFNEGLMDRYWGEAESVLLEDLNFKETALFHSYVMKSTNYFITPSNKSVPLSGSPGPLSSDAENVSVSYVDANFIQLWNINLLTAEYYHSPYFNRCFSMVEGRFPEKDNEILVDWSLAEKMSWESGQFVNISLGCSLIGLNLPPSLNESFYFRSNASQAASIDHVFIAGIYVSQNLESSLMGKFDYHWTYEWGSHPSDEVPTGPESFESWNDTQYLDTPIMGYFNQSAAPLEYYFAHVNTAVAASSPYMMDEDSFISFMGFYQLSAINLNHIASEVVQLQDEESAIKGAVGNYLGFYMTIDDTLQAYEDQVSFVLMGMQLMNIPLILFVLVIAGFALRSDIRNRVEELLLFKSKGSPNSLIITNIVIESLIIGGLSSVLGILLGFAVYPLINQSVTQFIASDSLSEVSLFVDGATYVVNVGIGLGIAVLSTMMSVFFVTKLSTNTLLSFMGANAGDIDYDVPTLFDTHKKNPSEKSEIFNDAETTAQNETSEAQTGADHQSQLQIGSSGEDSSGSFPKRKFSKVGLSWFFIVISLVPLLYYLLTSIARNYSVSDAWQRVSQFGDAHTTLMLVVFILSPIFLIIGLVRLITAEHLKIFAQISMIFSKLLPEAHRKIIVLNMMRKKSYRAVILILGILIAGFTSLNITLTSLVRYTSLHYNIMVGADVRLNFAKMVYIDEGNYPGLYGNYNVSSRADLIEMERDLKGIRTSEGGPLVNEVVTIFQVTRYGLGAVSLILMNFTQYLALIHGDSSKYQYNDELIDSLQDVIDYNANRSAGENLGMLANEAYYTLSTRLPMDISYYFDGYSEITDDFRYGYVICDVLGIVDVLPGWSGEEFDRPFLIADLRSWMLREPSAVGIEENSSLPTFEIKQLIDINNSQVPLSAVNQKLLENCIQKYTIPADTLYYNWQWDRTELNISQMTAKLYSTFYLEFYALGIVLSFGLAILFLNIQKAEKYHNGSLLARGLGKRNLSVITNLELVQVFLIASLIGLGCGFVSALPILEYAKQITFPIYKDLNLPIFLQIGPILRFLGLIPLVSLVIFNVYLKIEHHRHFNSYFQTI